MRGTPETIHYGEDPASSKGRDVAGRRNSATVIAAATKWGLDTFIGRNGYGLAQVEEGRGNHLEAMTHLDAAGALFAKRGAKLYLDEVIAMKSILEA